MADPADTSPLLVSLDPASILALRAQIPQKVIQIEPEADRFFEGRALTVRCTQSTADAPVEITTQRPTLLRIESLFDAGGTIWGSLTGIQIEMTASCRETPAGTSELRRKMVRNVGPFLWIPAAGNWRLVLTGPNTRFAEVTQFSGLAPDVAAAMMGGLPSRMLVETIILGGGGSSAVPSVGNATAFNLPNFFALVSLRIFNGGAAAATVAIGDTPVAGSFPIAAGAVLELDWRTLAGQSVAAFSAVGTTLYVLARYA